MLIIDVMKYIVFIFIAFIFFSSCDVESHYKEWDGNIQFAQQQYSNELEVYNDKYYINPCSSNEKPIGIRAKQGDYNRYDLEIKINDGSYSKASINKEYYNHGEWWWGLYCMEDGAKVMTIRSDDDFTSAYTNIAVIKFKPDSNGRIFLPDFIEDSWYFDYFEVDQENECGNYDLAFSNVGNPASSNESSDYQIVGCAILYLNIAKCQELDYGALNSVGQTCSEYYSYSVDYWCGAKNDEDFNAYEMCCHCGGGNNLSGNGVKYVFSVE